MPKSRSRKFTERALKHPELNTAANESVRTASGEHKGKEILFPTVRARGPGLEKLPVKQAFKESVQRGDFIEFDNPEKATEFATALSNQLGRQGQTPIAKLQKRQRAAELKKKKKK